MYKVSFKSVEKWRSSLRHNFFKVIFWRIRGYNSSTVCPIKLKIVSCTSPHPNACVYKVSLKSVEKCRSSLRHNIFKVIFWQFKGYNSAMVSPIKLKIVSCTPAHPNACMCNVSLKSLDKCRSSLRHNILNRKISFRSVEIYSKWQSPITLLILKIESWPLCTSNSLLVLYKCMKFH